VLGGTGIAVTRRAKPDAALIEHLTWLMSLKAQTGFIPHHDGQPSARASWQNEEVNARWGNFYRATFRTTEGAWLRPRFNGYVAFQTSAAALIRAALTDGTGPATALAGLRRLWRRAGGGHAL
jgi:multiple sugar transport system substrate-binding protein